MILGAMGAIVLTAEAAVANWSGVYLHDSLGASLGLAGLGYLAFATAQTAARLISDHLLTRRSPARLLRIATLTATTGLAIVVTSPSPALSIAGFDILGAGLATPLPILLSVVGHLDTTTTANPTALVARFSTITFTGFLLAPGAIGWIAELIGLTWTLTALIHS